MNTASSTLSSFEALLVTALRLAQAGRAAFSHDELIVAAWKAHPMKFGMKGFEEYPDSHRAISYLCGTKGLVGRAYLCRIKGQYALTEKGRTQAAQLLGEAQETPRTAPGGVGASNGPSVGLNGRHCLAAKCGPRKPLLPTQDALLLRLLDSSCRERDVRQLTFAEAAKWWGITNESPEAAEDVTDALAEILDLVAGGSVILPDRREATGYEIAELVQLDAALRQRFAAHLRLLANRNGKAHS